MYIWNQIRPRFIERTVYLCDSIFQVFKKWRRISFVLLHNLCNGTNCASVQWYSDWPFYRRLLRPNHRCSYRCHLHDSVEYHDVSVFAIFLHIFYTLYFNYDHRHLLFSSTITLLTFKVVCVKPTSHIFWLIPPHLDNAFCNNHE